MYVLSIVVCPFVLFLLAIVVSALLRYTVSDCPFSIFKLFFDYFEIKITNITHGIQKIIDTSTLMEVSKCFWYVKLHLFPFHRVCLTNNN